MQNGFNDFLSKPIDTAHLNTMLGNWIPIEKQRGTEKSKIKEGSLQTPSPDIISIDDLDTKKGVHLSEGKIESYYEALADFYKEGQERKNGIGKCLDADDFYMLITHVHALKNAASYVGADELAKVASALEETGLSTDLSHIKDDVNHFLTMLERVLSNIKTVL